jgi:hypothetical protein
MRMRDMAGFDCPCQALLAQVIDGPGNKMYIDWTLEGLAWDVDAGSITNPAQIPITVTGVQYDIRCEDHSGYCSDQDFRGRPEAKRVKERRVTLIMLAEPNPPLDTWAVDAGAHTCGCKGITADRVLSFPIPWADFMTYVISNYASDILPPTSTTV